MKKLSVAIAVYNEEKNIERCLASVASWVSEIVVVDGGSKDKTLEIVKKFTKKIIQTTNPPIFHINKQKALEACTNEWILQLDADEVIPQDLKEEILSTIERNPVENGYFIARRNYFWGHWMKKGGQYPDYVIRLVRKDKAHFPCKSVHEQIEIDGTTGYLTRPMLHYSNATRADYWKTADRYTTLTAHELKEQRVPKTLISAMKYILWKPYYTFLLLYIRHKGFVDGLVGFEFALYSGLHWAIAYKKYIAL